MSMITSKSVNKSITLTGCFILCFIKNLKVFWLAQKLLSWSYWFILKMPTFWFCFSVSFGTIYNFLVSDGVLKLKTNSGLFPSCSPNRVIPQKGFYWRKLGIKASRAFKIVIITWISINRQYCIKINPFCCCFLLISLISYIFLSLFLLAELPLLHPFIPLPCFETPLQLVPPSIIQTINTAADVEGQSYTEESVEGERILY